VAAAAQELGRGGEGFEMSLPPTVEKGSRLVIRLKRIYNF
jgi:hypothetical protein